MDTDAVEGATIFDGAGKYARQTSVSKPAEPGKAELLKELKQRVEIDDRGVPAERAALNSMLSTMMDSPSARELAGQFIAEDARATLSFEEIPGTQI